MRNFKSRGAAMIFVIVMLGLLSVFAVGFMAVGEAGIRSAVKEHDDIQAQVKAFSIHRALCRSISEDGLGEFLKKQEGEETVLWGFGELGEIQAEVRIREKREAGKVEIETDVTWGSYQFSFADDVSLEQERR